MNEQSAACLSEGFFTWWVKEGMFQRLLLQFAAGHHKLLPFLFGFVQSHWDIGV